jgi:glycosyltransferase involved in cell wall biosynthesis
MTTTTKSILITIPHPSFHGGVGNIFKTLELNKSDKIEYFPNTKANASGDLWFSLAMVLRFVRHIKGVCLVHLNPSLDAKAILRDGFLLLIAKLFSKKVVVFFHGWDDGFEKTIQNNFILRGIFTFVFDKADAYLLLGEIFNRKLISLGVRPKLVFYMPTIADNSFLTSPPSSTPSPDVLKVLFIGGFVPSKGIDIVINSFRKLREYGQKQRFELILAGDGPDLHKWKQFIDEEGIENVTFTGYVSGEAKHNVLCQADILLFPSYSEGLPCAIMEAMLYGLAIVTRPVGAIPYWVKHNVNGFLSESTDPEVFADGIQFLASKPDLLEAMSQTNTETAINNFTPDRIRDRLLNIYDTILK